jgi:hypothetical protein
VGRVSKECNTCNTAPRIERKCLINPLCDVVTIVDIDEDVNVNVGVNIDVNVSIGVDVGVGAGANRCGQKGMEWRGEWRGVEWRENVREERKVGVKVRKYRQQERGKENMRGVNSIDCGRLNGVRREVRNFEDSNDVHNDTVRLCLNECGG